VWNHLLAKNIESYQDTSKFIFRYDMDKLLPGLKNEFEWLAETPSGSLQRVWRNLDMALKRSFKPDAAGNRAGFPRFKRHGDRRSFYVTNDKMRFEGSAVVLPKGGAVGFRSGRLPEGKILGATVALEGDAWYCIVQCEVEIAEVAALPQADAVIGIDAGLTTLAVMSDGVSVAVPRTEQRRARRVLSLQRQLSRRKRGSKNRERTRRRLAKAQASLADARRDCRHKLTRSLVDRASVVVIEDLNVRAMSGALRLGKSVGLAGIGGDAPADRVQGPVGWQDRDRCRSVLPLDAGVLLLRQCQTRS